MGKLIKTKTQGLFRKTGGGWVIDKVIEGERLFKTLDDIPETLAKKILNKLVAEITEKRYFPVKEVCSLKVRDALNHYWEKKLQFKKSAKNAKFLFRPIDNYFGEKPIAQLTHDDVDEYVRIRLSQLTR